MSKIIFELVLQDVNAAQAIAKFRQEVKDANAEIKKGVGGDRFKELTEKVTGAKVAISKLTEEQKRLRKEFAATQVPTDSLTGLRIAYSKVTDQVNRLSKAEREADFGKRLIKQGAGLKAQIDGIEQSLGRFTGNVGNYKTAISGITGLFAAAGIGVGIAALVNFGKESVKAIDEQLKADAQIKAAIQSTAGIAGKSLSELKTQADALQKITLFSDDQTQNAQALLLTFTNIRGEIFDRTVPAVQDLATAFHQDLETSAKQVGKALNDPIKGVGALSKAGVQFSVEQKAMIKSLVQTGDLAGAQTLILKELETQIGGSAQAAAKAGAGPFQLLALQFGEVQESVGRLLLGGLSGLLDSMQSLADAANELVSVPLSEELQSQQVEFNALIGVLQDTTTEETTRLEVLKTLKANYPDYLKFVNDDAKGQLDLAATLQAGNALFEQRILLESTQERRTELVKERLKQEERLTRELIKQKAQEQAGASGTLAFQGKETTTTVGDISKRNVEDARKRINEVKKEIEDLVKVSDETALRTTGKTIAELSAQLAGVGTPKGGGAPTSGGGGKKPKEELDLVNGSLAFFRDQIADLQKTLDNTPPDSPLFKKLIKNIRDAETALAELQELIKTALDPADLDTISLPAEGITIPVTLEVQNEDEIAKKLEDFAKRTTKIGRDIKAESDAEQAEEDEKKRDDVEEAIKEAALNTAQAISDGIFQIQQDKLDREKNAALDALDEETAKKIENAQGNAALIAQIEKDADKKRKAIEKEAAERAKSLALKQAAIDTALAILKALTAAVPPFNYILAGAAAVAGAIQLAVIKKQEFAGGGRVKQLGSGIVNERPNHPTTSRGDNVLALVKSGEMILNEEQQRRLKALTSGDIFYRIGVPMHGVTSKLVPQFASGGFASDFTPQIALPQVANGQTVVVQTVAEFSDEQMDVLAARIALQTGRATKEGVGEGLEDNNRLQERQAALTRNREA